MFVRSGGGGTPAGPHLHRQERPRTYDWLLPEPFPDGHTVDSGLTGESGFGGVAGADASDGDLLEAREGVQQLNGRCVDSVGAISFF